MDKLKPILAQKFWILSGLCVILVVIGWWVDTAAMSKEITERTDVIKKAFDGIPKPGPNKLWTDQVEARNKEEAKVIKTGDQLWDNLVPLMVWPDAVREVVSKTTYRGPIDPTTRGEYRDAYEREMIDLWKIVSPFNPMDSTGMVMFDIATIPSEHLGDYTQHPSDKVAWDAQEDIWLYRALLEAVARTNELAGGETILNSVIKQIDVIQLRGGTPKAPGSGAPAAAAKPPGPPGAPGMMTGPSSAMHSAGAGGFGGPGAAGASGQAGGASTASFNPEEEFGSDVDTSAATTPAPGGMGAPAAGVPKPGGPSPSPMGPPMGPPGGAAGFGGQGAAAKKRYIEETKRYKTRGFYMEVVMDHRKLPEFLAQLSDSPWPTRIVRVQQVDRDTSDVGNTIVGTNAGPAGGPGGATKGMLSSGAAGGHGAARPGMGGPKAPMGTSTRPVKPQQQILGQPQPGANGEGGETLLDPNAALADPNLVNVAVAGIITLYLPPEPVATGTGLPGSPVPGAIPGAAIPGAPAPAGTPVNGAATPASPAPVNGVSPAGASGTPAAPVTGNPATGTPGPGTPAAGTPAVATPAAGPPANATPATGTAPSPVAVPTTNDAPADKAASPAAPAAATPDATKSAAEKAAETPPAEKK